MYGNKEKRIEKAFLKLYKEKEFESITVKEICRNAEISRATFYTYYTDTKSLLDGIEERLILEVSDIFKSWRFLDLRVMDTARPMPIYVEVYEYVYKHREVYQALFGPWGSHRFILRYNEMIHMDYLEKIQVDGIETTNAPMLAAFCAGSIIYSSNIWIEKITESSPGEMAMMATKIVLSIFHREYKKWGKW